MTLRSQVPFLAICLTLSFAGCSDRPDTSDIVPVEFTYIRIGQDQYITGGLHPEYAGSVAFPACRHNPNNFDLTTQNGYEVYQVLGPPNSGRKIVSEYDSGPRSFRAGFSSIPIAMDHPVLVNETVEGNSTNYTIHLWHQILNPDPVHRVDRWFNMTFTPYGPESTSYSEGTPC